jgi:hypothetical protein
VVAENPDELVIAFVFLLVVASSGWLVLTICRRSRADPAHLDEACPTTPGALVVILENKDPFLQVFYGASRTRTGDLLGAITADRGHGTRIRRS